MFIIDSYAVAVFFCFITMLCWGSWANTQKLASKEWSFPLFYWDYTLGVVILALILGLTMGSIGEEGRSFFADLAQGHIDSYLSAFLGGVVFNLANLLIVAAIAIAGMAVAFPIGIGLALVIGVLVNYIATPLGDPFLLFLGVGLVTMAIIVDAIAYNRLSESRETTPVKGILISILGGIFMGFFFRFVAASVSMNFAHPEPGMFTPYTGVFVFSLGVLASSFLWNSIFMAKPPNGEPVTYGDYFKKGNIKLHLIGMLGGIIWAIGMAFSMIASEEAGFAISYGLGQGATMIAAAWGVFIWKEFAGAPKGTTKLIVAMFTLFIVGLGLIVIARVN